MSHTLHSPDPPAVANSLLSGDGTPLVIPDGSANYASDIL